MGETKDQILNLINSGNFAELEQIVLGLNDDSLQELMNDLGYYQTKDIFLVCSDNAREKMINALKDNEQKQFMILELDSKKAYQFIVNNKDKIDDDIVKKIICDIIQISDVDLKKKILFEDKNLPNVTNIELHQILGKKFVKENIKEIVKLEFDENDIDKKLELITQIEEIVGDNIYHNMDFNILSTQYIDAIGIDGIISIALNTEKQNKLLSLDKTKLEILGRCLNNNSFKNEPDTYKMILDKMLENIATDNFNNLFSDIDDIAELTDIDIQTFQQIIQNNNRFEINNLNELRDYGNAKKRKCDEWIKSDNIEEKRLAVFEKIFGQDWCLPFYYDIEEIQDENIKKYLKCIKEISKINIPQILDKIYNECSEQMEVDKFAIEKEIKSEYGKLYNEGLFIVDNAQRLEIDGNNNVFEAGTDFAMIIHSRIGIRNSGGSKNYYDDWYRNKNSQGFADYFCASYIRNDMITGAGIEDNVVYGFSSLSPRSFCGSSQADMGTTLNSIESCSSPEYIINNTGNAGRGVIMATPYNEIDYKYFSDGKRQQPSYIVVFRINGELTNWKKAINAQHDWKGKLPIVIVDVNKCIESEKQKVEEMKKKYEKTKSPVLARQIYIKIRNNQHTIKSYKGKLQESFFEGELEQYLISDDEIKKYMEENKEYYGDISPTIDKPKSKIEIIYDKINTIISEKDTTEKETDNDIQEEKEQIIQAKKQDIETKQSNSVITPKDIAKLDQDKKMTTTEVKQNVVKRLLEKVKEKFIQGKNKDGR